MNISYDTNEHDWDSFLSRQTYRPFLQSWTMGEVYRDCGQEPIRLAAMDEQKILGICQALFVPARRGKHLAVLYGPIVEQQDAAAMLIDALKEEAKKRGCAFLRISPFAPTGSMSIAGSLPSPLHTLAEHVWHLPLQNINADTIFSNMRATARNLIRRAEKDGVTVRASKDPNREIEEFLRLHDETRKRHGFTPYTNAFFRAQVKHFASRNECTLYLAEFQGNVIAASIHMHVFGETSYHHGASSYEHRKIPASYLLQWTAIKDALKRGDSIYNFWGIAPVDADGKAADPKHPFAGVTLFKTGFGGKLLTLEHCRDVPLSKLYYATRAFETFRKWKRGF